MPPTPFLDSPPAVPIRVDSRVSDRPQFRRALLGWFAKHGRDLPWRRTRDPYAILVSEFMLQQTQVATVIPYYIEWLRRFPTVSALADASESDVLHAWQGLGYYSRARNLHAAAKAIGSRSFPRDPKQIEKLPGVGRYTAHAVATFAFDQSVPIVEANTARVLARLFDMHLPIDTTAGKAALWQHADELLPKRRAGIYNSALMDIGAMICISRAPRCDICPVRSHCLAPDPGSLPIKRPRTALQLITEDHAFTRQPGKILLEQSLRRWRGLWMLPRLTSHPATDTPIYSAQFPFTHHRVTLRVFRREIEPNSASSWFGVADVEKLAMPSPHRRALDALLRNSTLDVRRSASDVSS